MIESIVGSRSFILNEEGEVYCIKTARLKNPRLFPYDWEQRVTNGLGYAPVKKSMMETKTNTTGGLREHLKNMHLLEIMRKDFIIKAIYEEHYRNMLILDEVYKKINDKFPKFSSFISALQGSIKTTPKKTFSS